MIATICIQFKVIAISGEAGSGKSTAAGMALRMLLHCTETGGQDSAGLGDRIRDVPTLLEAFGNARTSTVCLARPHASMYRVPNLMLDTESLEADLSLIAASTMCPSTLVYA